MFKNKFKSRGDFRSVNQSKSLLFARKTIVLGSDIEGVRIAESILNRFDSGLDLIGYIDKNYQNQRPLQKTFHLKLLNKHLHKDQLLHS